MEISCVTNSNYGPFVSLCHTAVNMLAGANNNILGID